MKRELVKALTVLGLVWGGSGVMLWAAPRKFNDVTKTSRNEGDTRAPFSIACSSSAWSTVVAARVERRSVLIHTLTNPGGGVCLSTYTTSSSIACDDSANGVELSTSSAYTDYGEGAITCRIRALVPTTRVKGMDYYDSRD